MSFSDSVQDYYAHDDEYCNSSLRLNLDDTPQSCYNQTIPILKGIDLGGQTGPHSFGRSDTNSEISFDNSCLFSDGSLPGTSPSTERSFNDYVSTSTHQSFDQLSNTKPSIKYEQGAASTGAFTSSGYLSPQMYSVTEQTQVPTPLRSGAARPSIYTHVTNPTQNTQRNVADHALLHPQHALSQRPRSRSASSPGGNMVQQLPSTAWTNVRPMSRECFLGQDVPQMDLEVSSSGSSTPFRQGELSPETVQFLQSYSNQSENQERRSVPNPEKISCLSTLTGYPPQIIEQWFRSTQATENQVQVDEEDRQIKRLRRQSLQRGCGKSPRSTAGRFKCTAFCGFESNSKEGWIRHEKIRAPQEFWKCPLCPKISTRSSHLGDHIKRYHKDDPQNPLAQKSAKKARNCLTRFKLEHSPSFKKHCGFCGAVFRNWHKLYNDHIYHHYKFDGRVYSQKDWKEDWDPQQTSPATPLLGPNEDSQSDDSDCDMYNDGSQTEEEQNSPVNVRIPNDTAVVQGENLESTSPDLSTIFSMHDVAAPIDAISHQIWDDYTAEYAAQFPNTVQRSDVQPSSIYRINYCFTSICDDATRKVSSEAKVRSWLEYGLSGQSQGVLDEKKEAVFKHSSIAKPSDSRLACDDHKKSAKSNPIPLKCLWCLAAIHRGDGSKGSQCAVDYIKQAKSPLYTLEIRVGETLNSQPRRVASQFPLLNTNASTNGARVTTATAQARSRNFILVIYTSTVYSMAFCFYRV